MCKAYCGRSNKSAGQGQNVHPQNINSVNILYTCIILFIIMTIIDLHYMCQVRFYVKTRLRNLLLSKFDGPHDKGRIMNQNGDMILSVKRRGKLNTEYWHSNCS